MTLTDIMPRERAQAQKTASRTIPLIETLAQAKLIHGENQNGCCPVRGDCPAEDTFRSDGNIRYLDGAAGHTGVSICKDARSDGVRFERCKLYFKKNPKSSQLGRGWRAGGGTKENRTMGLIAEAGSGRDLLYCAVSFVCN